MKLRTTTVNSDYCPRDGLTTYHTVWWCETLRRYPGFGPLVEEFELLLDSFVSSELDHIEDPDYDEVDRNTIGMVHRDAESRRIGFRQALLSLVVTPNVRQSEALSTVP